MFATIRFALLLPVLAIGACSREPTPAPSPATTNAPSVTTPVPPPATALAPADIPQWIADLSAADAPKRLAATQALFQLGPAALEPLRQAGAQQISPFGTTATRRLDMIYSLLAGLEANPAGGHAGYTADSFGLHVENGCTAEEITKLGDKYGFTISGSFQPAGRPACYVKLNRGKNLAEVLEAILSDEPRVISANLNYFER